MTSQAPDFEVVLQRLEKVENENRFLRRMGFMILLLTGGSLALNPRVRSLWTGLQSQSLEADEFVLKEGSGSVGAKLVVSGDAPTLSAYDAHGKPGRPFRTERVSLEDAQTMSPELESGRYGPRNDDSVRIVPGFSPLWWESPSLIGTPEWNFEVSSKPRLGEFKASPSAVAGSASVATTWQPSALVPSGSGSLALLSGLAAVWREAAESVQSAWELPAGRATKDADRFGGASAHATEGKANLDQAPPKRLRLNVAELEWARTQFLALKQVTRQTKAGADTQPHEPGFNRPGELGGTAVSLPTPSDAGSASLEALPNRYSEARVAQLAYAMPLRATPSTATIGAPAGDSSAEPVSSPGVPAGNAVKLKILGYVDKPGVGREVVISDDHEVYVTHEGETFADRFKVLKITPTTVDVLDTSTNQTVRLNLL